MKDLKKTSLVIVLSGFLCTLLLFSCQEEEVNLKEIEISMEESTPLPPSSSCVSGSIRPCVGNAYTYTCTKPGPIVWSVSDNACIQSQTSNSVTIRLENPNTLTTITACYGAGDPGEGCDSLTVRTRSNVCGTGICSNV